jgi:hypothetical protein
MPALTRLTRFLQLFDPALTIGRRFSGNNGLNYENKKWRSIGTDTRLARADPPQ